VPRGERYLPFKAGKTDYTLLARSRRCRETERFRRGVAPSGMPARSHAPFEA